MDENKESKLETLLHRNYFSKSYTFLYPLLNIPGHVYNPEKTYIAWKGKYVVSDYTLICKFIIEQDSEKMKAWEDFLVNEVLGHPRFFSQMTSGDGQFLYCAFTFNTLDVRADWNAFLRGKYSEFSATSKEAIRTYYGYNSVQWAYLESFLYPERFFRIMAGQLTPTGTQKETRDMEAMLREVGELCTPYSRRRETLVTGAQPKKDVLSGGKGLQESSTEPEAIR